MNTLRWLTTTSRRVVLASALTLSLSLIGHAQSEFVVPVGKDGVEIPVTRYKADETSLNTQADTASSKLPLFLWLPSSRGTQPPQKITANTLAEFGYEVWIADSHLGYFVDAGRRSVDQFPDEDMADLIEAAIEQSGRDVILMTRGRAAKNALGASRAYQLRSSQNNQAMRVIGHVLFGPNLRIPPQTPGDPGSYQAIAKSSNLPSFIIQAGISTGTWRANEVVKTLQGGGAQVYLKTLPGIQGGFHLRPDEDLTEDDFSARDELPFLLERAAKLLKLSSKPTVAAPLVAAKQQKSTKSRYGIKSVKPYTAVLTLPDVEGVSHRIESHQGRVALVSFWASWCEPCIRELPSLKRLHDDYKARGLDIITVNAGEDSTTIKATANKLDMNGYSLLMDSDGDAVKAWNIYGFPTNFLVNQSGQVVYGSFGAVEWDEPEARAAVESLLQ